MNKNNGTIRKENRNDMKDDKMDNIQDARRITAKD